MTFKYSLGQPVVLVTSEQAVLDEHEEAQRALSGLKDDEAMLVQFNTVEAGEIVGRAEYTAKQVPDYLVRYKDGMGCQREAWFGEDAITTETEILADAFQAAEDPEFAEVEECLSEPAAPTEPPVE